MENLSTIVRTVVIPSDRKGPVTKSKEMSDQGCLGTGRGCRRPGAGRRDFLFLTQTRQAATYSSTSFSVCLNRCRTTNRVQLTPGWQENGKALAQLITCGRSSETTEAGLESNSREGTRFSVVATKTVGQGELEAVKKNRAHLTWCVLSHLADQRYSRFL